MGLKENRRGLRKTPEDDGYRRRLKEGPCIPKHSMTIKKGAMHSYSLEDYDNNASPG